MTRRQRPSEEEFDAAARRLGCSVPAIKAVTEIEAPGGAFLEDGRPVVLFERHVFRRLTGGRFDAIAPDLSHPVPGGYSIGRPSGVASGAWQHSRIAMALALDREAALQAASWGLFQILGQNFAAAGFDDVAGFVAAMRSDVEAHLGAFCRFVLADGRLARALQGRDWLTFARIYNGPAQGRHRYADRIASAYLALAEDEEPEDAPDKA